MHLYNKLKLGIFSCLISQQIYALNLMPVDIQSAPGELLYAEIAFQHANPDQPLGVGLASVEDLNQLGVNHYPPGHLNFFVRQSSSDTGVITITSSRPMIETELNIVLKIQHAGAIRLQHIKTRLANLPTQKPTTKQEKSLVPIKIVREEEIALNLPVATQHEVVTPQSNHTQERPLQLSHTPPPLLQGTALSAQLDHTVQAQPSATPRPSITKNAQTSERLLVVQKSLPPPLETTTLTLTKPETASSASENNNATAAVINTPISHAPKQHVVQSNESLWGISAQIAQQHQLPIATVMQEIKTHNPQAFIGGDPNKLRRGATLNFDLSPTLVRQDAIARKDLPNVASKQSGKAKYRLSEAQMSLVAEKQADSTQGSAKKSTQSKKSSEQLALKVMTAREKSVKLQRNVTHLDQTLKQKDHRIQLLNTRLAQLQQQLKTQQVKKK